MHSLTRAGLRRQFGPSNRVPNLERLGTVYDFRSYLETSGVAVFR